MAGSQKMHHAPNRSHTYGGSEPLGPETISRPVLGPGGPSLGGGFQVMLPVGETTKQQRMKLPKVASSSQGLVAEDNPASNY